MNHPVQSQRVRAIAASGTALSSLRDGAELHRLHPPGFNRMSRGHRGYLDAPRLISTRSHKTPVARGHRAFLNIGRIAR